jgi:Domain of unknown function (DUF4261)
MSEKADQVMAMIMLERPATLDVPQLVAKVGPLLGIKPEVAPQPNASSFVLVGSGGLIMGMMIAAPMPLDAYKGPAETAFWWPDAFQVASRHKAHLIASCAWSGETRLNAHLKHTVLVRGLIEQVPATAVSWRSVLVSADQFKGLFQVMQTEQKPPIRLWIKIQLSRDGKGGTIASTLGMRDFGLMEIECNSAPMAPTETCQLIENLASYLIANGPVVEDGHTVGDNAAQRITVRHAPSFRNGVGTIYLIDFSLPGEPKPGLMASVLGKAFGRRH